MSDMFDTPTPGVGRKIFVVVGIIVCLGGLVYLFVPAISKISSGSAIRKEGVPATAEILSVSQTRDRINEDWVFDLHLRVKPTGMPAYYARASQPFSLLHVPNLRQGAWVTIKFDPKNPQKLWVMSTGVRAPEEDTPQPKVARPKPAARKSPPTDPVCQATTRCCLIAMGRGAKASCLAFSNTGMAPTACAAALPTYRAAARKKGKRCK